MACFSQNIGTTPQRRSVDHMSLQIQLEMHQKTNIMAVAEVEVVQNGLDDNGRGGGEEAEDIKLLELTHGRFGAR